MKKYTDAILEILIGTPANKAIFNMWGGKNPVSMGDGLKFRVTKSSSIDYVYIKYLAGYDSFEIEYGALVGTEYDRLDTQKPISKAKLMATISARVFGYNGTIKFDKKPVAAGVPVSMDKLAATVAARDADPYRIRHQQGETQA